jgi:hypothetical protein
VLSAPQTANRSSYALNNPFRYTDPSGRFIQAAIDHPGELASFVLSIPVLPGLAIAAIGAVTGTDPLTGRVLSGEERAAGLLFAGFGPFGKALGGVARAAATRIDDVLGSFLRGIKALPGRGLEALRGLRGRGLGLLDDVSGALRARLGAIGRGGAAVEQLATRAAHLEERAGLLTAALNPIRARRNPVGVASGLDDQGREIIYVAQKAGRLDREVAGLLAPNEVPVIASADVHAEIQAIEAAEQAGNSSILAAARPNLVCVECEAYAIRAAVYLTSPTRASRFATEAARLRALLAR